MFHKKAVLLPTIIILILFTGCAPSVKNLGKSSAHMQETKHVTTQLEYKKLFDKYLDENKTDDLLWDYEAGTVGYYVKEYKDSVFYFDKAEDLIKKYDEEILASKVLSSVGAALTNDTFMDYRPKIYEKIMVNTYKAINFINMRDFQNARIEFNRALVREDRAKEFFAKEIGKEKEKLQQEQKKKLQNVKIKKETTSPIEKKYSNLFAFKPYRDFTNPFTSYLAGIYFLSIGDYDKATDLLKECYGMIKGLDAGADYVKADFELADKMKGSLTQRAKHYTWVIFLNGLAPKKEEWKIDVPVFLVSKKVLYTGIALPTLKMRPKAYRYLEVTTPHGTKKTKEIATMDRVIKLEFKKRFPVIMTRALTRTIVQTVIQKQLHDKYGFFGGLVGAAYQGIMNKADTRMWERLPKEFQVARLYTPEKLDIFTPDKKHIASIFTNSAKNYIVFVTIPSKSSEPIVSYQAF
ncbi:hypothetical protein NitYY0826_C0106 [Nitratiruptor sp. YY08-26]|uniref:COG3014 family protein n=1 Tax=unclassified Nitratiruptor TaxID=2624044 RepID=UPI00191561A1|nr:MULTISPECIES: hypothetical protein [unclassified Nitratiruptor]BCD61272.1 hypothetical protein NitYY0813_C0106 [Nitratiruptor sp. YY08-13]BCD65205.1 hypothetical protein NitYY0826_C0106 [Nitratiruptor sp. YY08-26]